MANYHKFYETHIYREEYGELFGLDLEWSASLYPIKEKFENYAEWALKEKNRSDDTHPWNRTKQAEYDAYMYWCNMIQKAIDDNATIIEENKKDPRKLYAVMYDIGNDLLEKMKKAKKALPPFLPDDGDFDDRLFKLHTCYHDVAERLEGFIKNAKYIKDNFDEYISIAMFSPYRKR